MPYAVLEKEIGTLSHAAISEVIDFVRLVNRTSLIIFYAPRPATSELLASITLEV